MWVCVEQILVDLLVVLVVINFLQPSAISPCAKYNIVSLPSLIALCWASGPQQTAGPSTPTCLQASRVLQRSAVQIHFDMPPNASMGMIKKLHLLGKTFRQIHLGTDLITSLQLWSLSHTHTQHSSFQQPVGLFVNCVWLEYVTLLMSQIRRTCLVADGELFHTNCPSLSLPILPPSLALTMPFPVVSLCPLLSVFLIYSLIQWSDQRCIAMRLSHLSQRVTADGRAQAQSDLSLPNYTTPIICSLPALTCKGLNWASTADLKLLH